MIIYIGLRLTNVAAIKEPKIYPDTQRYLDMATQPLFSLDFWAGPYPVMVPTIFKMLGSNPTAITWFQLGISIIAWTWLSYAVSSSIRTNWLRKLTFIAILALSLERTILLWDGVLLSESLSGSLLALYLGTWLWYLKEKKDRWLALFMLAFFGLLWAFTRDTNALFNLGVILVILVGIGLRYFFPQFQKSTSSEPKNVLNLVLAGILLTSFLFSNHFANLAGRWIGPSMSALGIRVLVAPEKTSFFEAEGMPVNAELMSFAGQKALAIDGGFGDDPALDSFHDWYRENGKTVFVKFILSTPVASLLAPLQNMSPLFDTIHLTYYKPAGFNPILPPPLEKMIFFEYWNTVVTILSLSVFVVGLVFAIKHRHSHWLVLLFLLIALYPHAFLIWHASACDMERHAYQFRLHFNLTFLLSLLFVGDQIVATYQESLKKRFPLIISALSNFWLGFIILGIILSGLAIFMDFITGNAADFSIGYAQGVGILLGFSLVGGGIWLRSLIKTGNLNKP